MPNRNMAIIIPAVFYCLLLSAGLYGLFTGFLNTTGYLMFNLYAMCSILFALVYGIFGYFMTRRVWFPTLLNALGLLACIIFFLVTALATGNGTFTATYDGAAHTVSVTSAALSYSLSTLLYSCGTVAAIAAIIKVIRKVTYREY